MAAIGVLGAVPVAVAMIADPFGPPEVVDPVCKPWDLYSEQDPILGVDAAGNALYATFQRDTTAMIRWPSTSAAERRGSGRWSARPRTTSSGTASEVAPDGTAMAVWRADDAGGTQTYYSSVRPPGGAWGTPQVIVADETVTYVEFAISDTGAAIASWGDTSPAGIWTRCALRAACGARRSRSRPFPTSTASR